MLLALSGTVQCWKHCTDLTIDTSRVTEMSHGSAVRQSTPAVWLGHENPNRLVSLWDIVNRFKAARPDICKEHTIGAYRVKQELLRAPHSSWPGGGEAPQSPFFYARLSVYVKSWPSGKSGPTMRWECEPISYPELYEMPTFGLFLYVLAVVIFHIFKVA